MEACHHGLNARAKASLKILGLHFLVWNEVYNKPQQLNELSHVLHYRHTPLN